MSKKKPRKDVEGTVYLLHFERPYKHARHYLGWTENDVQRRIQEHKSGKGARLMAVITGAGIGFQLARTWAGTRVLERRLKNGKCTPSYCPVCREAARV